ncbi:MAG TPA: ABC transporter substrate-binding protein [Symbiobacteriaceae bacterium]|nr:ABC transporter substrate-binding protein [Symbiobacteriaceae bacterium]
MSRKFLVGLLSVLVASSLIVSACTTKKPTGETGKEPTTGAGKPAAGGEVVFASVDDPDTLALYWLSSAYAAEITNRVFGDGLMRIGYDYKPEPALAERQPDISADGKTYTFKIRQGVKFHDGKPLTAHDFEFSYNFILSDDYQGPDKSTYSMIQSTKAKDDYTLEITLKEAFAPFLFGGASLQPMPKHIFGSIPPKELETADAWKNPIGAGPYKFKEWKSGQYVLIERNPDYWEMNKPGQAGGTYGPWVQTIRMRIIPEENTAMAALEAGELSFRDSVEPAHVDRLKNEKKDLLASYDWNRMGYGYQTFNVDAFPTNIKEVRQALSYGLNREAIIKGVMDNKASIPPGFIPPIHWAFDKTIKGYPYDAKKAEDLIKAAGFTKNAKGIYEKDGKPLKIKYVGTKDSTIVEGIALQAKKDWGAIGVDVELVMVDFNTLLDKHMKPGDFNVFFSGLGFSNDPHYSFHQNYHSSNIRLDAKGVNNGSNRARYKNPKVDELIDKGARTTDLNERLKIYQEAQKLIIDDAPANWIYVNVWTDFAKKDLKGVVNWDGYGINTTQYMNQWYTATSK